MQPARKLPEIECLKRENAFLKRVLEEMENYTRAETDGILAYKAGSAKTSNPYDKNSHLDEWIQWDAGWDSECLRTLSKSIVRRTAGLLDKKLSEEDVLRLQMEIAEFRDVLGVDAPTPVAQCSQ